MAAVRGLGAGGGLGDVRRARDRTVRVVHLLRQLVPRVDSAARLARRGHRPQPGQDGRRGPSSGGGAGPGQRDRQPGLLPERQRRRSGRRRPQRLRRPRRPGHRRTSGRRASRHDRGDRPGRGTGGPRARHRRTQPAREPDLARRCTDLSPGLRRHHDPPTAVPRPRRPTLVSRRRTTHRPEEDGHMADKKTWDDLTGAQRAGIGLLGVVQLGTAGGRADRPDPAHRRAGQRAEDGLASGRADQLRRSVWPTSRSAAADVSVPSATAPGARPRPPPPRHRHRRVPGGPALGVGERTVRRPEPQGEGQRLPSLADLRAGVDVEQLAPTPATGRRRDAAPPPPSPPARRRRRSAPRPPWPPGRTRWEPRSPAAGPRRAAPTGRSRRQRCAPAARTPR